MTPTIPALRARQFKYFSLAAIAIQQRFAFRGAVALDLAVNLAQTFAIMYLWRGVFADTPQLGSFDYERMKTYILISYVVGSITFSGVVYRVTNLVRTGAIVTNLTRPIDFMYAILTEAVGDAAIRGLISFLIAVLLSGLFFHVLLPVSLLAGVFFLLSMALGFLVRITFDFAISLFSCYTLNGRGLGWIQWGLVSVFSGAVIPLEFFPPGLKTLASLLPFQAIISTPLNIYLGNVQNGDLWAALGLQVFWLLAFWLLCRVMMGPCLRALEIQGG